MSDMWNSWEVNPPPICSVKTELHVTEISHLKDITASAVRTLKGLSVLDKEAAMLSRFLYKYKRIFRHDKGLQNLVKVNQCLKRYLKLNMSGVLCTFNQSLPHKLPACATHSYLPTKQMLKWVLLRLEAFSQIFARIIKLSKQTGAYTYQKLCLGWSLNLSLMVFSMTARILVVAKFITLKAIEWYSSFYKSLPFLKQTAEFLPEYKFPADLKEWLGPLDLTPLKKKTLIDNIIKLIDLTRGDDDDDDADEVKIVGENFLKTVFNMNVGKDTSSEEITIMETEERGKGVKRVLQSTLNEDFGVPVGDEGEDFDRPKKRRRKQGKRLKH